MMANCEKVTTLLKTQPKTHPQSKASNYYILLSLFAKAIELVIPDQLTHCHVISLIMPNIPDMTILSGTEVLECAKAVQSLWHSMQFDIRYIWETLLDMAGI